MKKIINRPRAGGSPDLGVDMEPFGFRAPFTSNSEGGLLLLRRVKRCRIIFYSVINV